MATSLRSFFRFLRTGGLGADRLEDAVPMVPHRRSGLVRHLDPGRSSSSSPRWTRHRPATCVTGRSSCAWPGWACGSARSAGSTRRHRLASGVISVSPRKTGHGALLPIPGEVGAALADYLQHGRPDTTAREVFVLVRLRRALRSATASWGGRWKGPSPGWDRGAHPWREPAAPLAGHRAAGPRRRLERDRRLARAQSPCHDSDLRRGRCRGLT